MWHILYYLTIELNHAKRDPRLAAYVGVVLQRFEFKKRLVWERNGFAGKVNSAYILWKNLLTLLLCCIFWCLPPPQADLTRFRRVIVRWVSTAKRKTRLHTDFRNARCSKQVNPLKITLPTHFLRRIEEEVLKVHASLLAVQFRPQRLRYETFLRNCFAHNFKYSLVQRE